MRLSEELLERVEEFFDVIPNESADVELDSAMDGLRRLLEEDIDGWTHDSEDELAFKSLCRMEELWDLVPDSEKGSELEEYFEDIMRELESESTPYLENYDADEYKDETVEEYSEGEAEEGEWG